MKRGTLQSISSQFTIARFGQPAQLPVKISPILTGETSPRVSSDINFCRFNSHVTTFRPRFLHSQVPPKPLKATIWQFSRSTWTLEWSKWASISSKTKKGGLDPMIHIWSIENWQHWDPLCGASFDVRKFGDHLIWDCWRKLWFFMMYGIFVTSANIAEAVPSKTYITTIHPVSLLITRARRKENMSLKVKKYPSLQGFLQA